MDKLVIGDDSLHHYADMALRTGNALCDERAGRLVNHAVRFAESDLADGRKIELMLEKLEQIKDEFAKGRRSLTWQRARLESYDAKTF